MRPPDAADGSGVWLRPTTVDDLTVLYEFQADPVGAEMAAFPSRDWPTYLAHQTGVIADPTTVKMTVLVGAEIVGDMGCWGAQGAREVGYWIGREFWGRHIATDALRLFLDVVSDRPLRGYVVPSNPASQKVLLSCGFVETGVDGEHLVFTLR
jgi:RimJ/RimL family protein N-acetyltransferase